MPRPNSVDPFFDTSKERCWYDKVNMILPCPGFRIACPLCFTPRAFVIQSSKPFYCLKCGTQAECMYCNSRSKFLYCSNDSQNSKLTQACFYCIECKSNFGWNKYNGEDAYAAPVDTKQLLNCKDCGKKWKPGTRNFWYCGCGNFKLPDFALVDGANGSDRMSKKKRRPKPDNLGPNKVVSLHEYQKFREYELTVGGAWEEFRRYKDLKEELKVASSELYSAWITYKDTHDTDDDEGELLEKAISDIDGVMSEILLCKTHNLWQEQDNDSKAAWEDDEDSCACSLVKHVPAEPKSFYSEVIIEDVTDDFLVKRENPVTQAKKKQKDKDKNKDKVVATSLKNDDREFVEKSCGKVITIPICLADLKLMIKNRIALGTIKAYIIASKLSRDEVLHMITDTDITEDVVFNCFENIASTKLSIQDIINLKKDGTKEDMILWKIKTFHLAACVMDEIRLYNGFEKMRTAKVPTSIVRAIIDNLDKSDIVSAMSAKIRNELDINVVTNPNKNSKFYPAHLHPLDAIDVRDMLDMDWPEPVVELLIRHYKITKSGQDEISKWVKRHDAATSIACVSVTNIHKNEQEPPLRRVMTKVKNTNIHLQKNHSESSVPLESMSADFNYGGNTVVDTTTATMMDRIP